MNRVLVDSSFLIALFRKDDLNHPLAIENKDVLNNSCFITNLVICEVLTVLAMKTKDMDLVNLAFNYINDNFTLVKEFHMHNFNYYVFSFLYHIIHQGVSSMTFPHRLHPQASPPFSETLSTRISY